MINGIINVKKEAGYTSHDVVAKLRKILKQKKIGHTGTLDPQATGVLPVCLGKGTRLCDMITDKEKTYCADLLLGITTDTQDTTGEVLMQRPVECSEDQVREIITGFLGPQMQIPPMYSALKVNGRKLYQLAREGVVIERQARSVEFIDIQILKMNLPRVTFSVTCSKGTYIRTLCHDIGEKLGCGGAMEKLVRTRVGRFDIENSLTLDEITQLQEKGMLLEHISSLEEMFENLPAFYCREGLDKLLHNGNPLKIKDVTENVVEGWIKAYDSSHNFVGIYQLRLGTDQYFPVKMFL